MHFSLTKKKWYVLSIFCWSLMLSHNLSDHVCDVLYPVVTESFIDVFQILNDVLHVMSLIVVRIFRRYLSLDIWHFGHSRICFVLLNCMLLALLCSVLNNCCCYFALFRICCCVFSICDWVDVTALSVKAEGEKWTNRCALNPLLDCVWIVWNCSLHNWCARIDQKHMLQQSTHYIIRVVIWQLLFYAENFWAERLSVQLFETHKPTHPTCVIS